IVRAKERCPLRSLLSVKATPTLRVFLAFPRYCPTKPCLTFGSERGANRRNLALTQKPCCVNHLDGCDKCFQPRAGEGRRVGPLFPCGKKAEGERRPSFDGL